MPEHDMPIEEQVKLLVKKLDGFEKKLDEKFVKIDEKFVKIDERFDQVDKKFDQVDKRFDKVDEKFDKVDERFDKVDVRFDKVDERIDQVMVRLEETKDIAKLGLEGLQGLRESMEGQFAAAAKTNADQTGLLKAVLVHVRNRVEVLERPKPRRR